MNCGSKDISPREFQPTSKAIRTTAAEWVCATDMLDIDEVRSWIVEDKEKQAVRCTKIFPS
jgi:hypothetical protein